MAAVVAMALWAHGEANLAEDLNIFKDIKCPVYSDAILEESNRRRSGIFSSQEWFGCNG